MAKAKQSERLLRVCTQGSAFGMLTQIWVDKVTGVNSLYQRFGGSGGGLTPLLKSDGTPVVTSVADRYRE